MAHVHPSFGTSFIEIGRTYILMPPSSTRLSKRTVHWFDIVQLYIATQIAVIAYIMNCNKHKSKPSSEGQTCNQSFRSHQFILALLIMILFASHNVTQWKQAIFKKYHLLHFLTDYGNGWSSRNSNETRSVVTATRLQFKRLKWSQHNGTSFRYRCLLFIDKK